MTLRDIESITLGNREIVAVPWDGLFIKFKKNVAQNLQPHAGKKLLLLFDGVPRTTCDVNMVAGLAERDSALFVMVPCPDEGGVERLGAAVAKIMEI